MTATTATNFERKSELAGRVRRAIDDAPERISDLDRSLTRFTTERPLVATAIALCAGFILARFLARA